MSVLSARGKIPAEELYLGRSVKDVLAVRENLQAKLLFISAGLGLVEDSTPIPSYNLSASDPNGPLLKALGKMGVTTQHWWGLLNDENPISARINNCANTIFWLSLPSSYLNLIDTDLNQIHEDAVARLRIFTSPTGVRRLNERLQTACLPYDERLNGIPKFAGTRNDFPQRALRHFVTAIFRDDLSLAESKKLVSNALKSCSIPRAVKGKRATDDFLVSLIADYRSRTDLSATRMLRILRDELKVSCAQSRFVMLWNRVSVPTTGVGRAA